MRTAAACLLFLSGPVMAADYADGVSGEEAVALISETMEAAGVSTPPLAAPIRPFPACNTAPAIAPREGSWTTVELTCAQPPWKRAFRTRAATPQFETATPEPQDIPLTDGPMAVSLSRSLQAGDLVTAADIVMIPRSAHGPLDVFTSPEQVIGRRMKSSLGAEQILLTRHLEPDWIVRNGTPIALQVAAGPVTVIAPGEALQNGRLGDVIELRNTSSGQIVRGIVTGVNTVALRANMP